MNYVKIRERKRTNGRVYFFLEVNHNGIRKQEATGLYYVVGSSQKRAMKQKAEEQRRLRERDLERGYFGTSKMEIDLINYFEEHNKARGFDKINSPYECSLKKLKAFVNQNNYKTTFDRLENNTKFFQEFANYLVKEMRSQNTAWSYLVKLKAVLNRAVRERIIIQSPARDVRIKWKEVEKTFLTIKEIEILSETKCNYDIIKLAFLFSCFTGLRLSDVRKLKWKDIKQEANGTTTLNFRQKKTGGLEYFPLNNTALDLVKATITSPNVIPHPETLIFSLPYISKISRAINSWVKRAKIDKHITFHSGRHSFAVNALTSGVDIFTVSKLLGHRDLKTTMVYAKIVDSKLIEAVNKLPKIQLG